MLPPPNPPGSSKANNGGDSHRPRPYPLHRAPLSSASTSTNESGATSSSSSAASIPTISNHGGQSQLQSREMPRTSKYEEDEDIKPIAGPSRSHRAQPQARPSVGGFGSTIEVDSGCLKGKTIRFSLTLAQEPIHGRRKTEKDRRPLAHCPILRFKIRQVERDGTEVDMDMATLEPGYFICAAELFEVSTSSSPSISSTRPDAAKTRVPVGGGTHPSIPEDLATQSATEVPRVGRRPAHADGQDTYEDPDDESMDHRPPPPPPPPHRAASWAADGPSGMAGMSPAARLRAEADFPLAPPARPPVPRSNQTSGRSTSASATDEPVEDLNSISRIARPVNIPETLTRPASSSATGEQTPVTPSRPAPLRTAAQRSSGSSGDGESTGVKPSSKRVKQGGEDSKWSASQQILGAQRNLFGSLHVPAVRVIAPEGEMGLWFLFTDLSVRQEGTFALRFRVFDITAADKVAGTAAQPLAEARSRAFKVYSPRNFPGLPKPTELAEHFAKQGFKLNTRKNERQAKTPPPDDLDVTPHRPEVTPIQSNSSGENVTPKDVHAENSSSSDKTSQRPGTAGTATTNTNTTTGSASLSGESFGTSGTVNTVATSVSATGSSKERL